MANVPPVSLVSNALCRKIPASFIQALHMDTLSRPLNAEVAAIQHESYVNALKSVGLTVTELEADEHHPDCCFVEDNAIIIGTHAIITRMGADSRQGEEAAVREALQRLGLTIHEMDDPEATIDGGDVLRIGASDLVVGLSKRTNEKGANALQRAFSDCRITAIAVADGLHLKSHLSCIHMSNGTEAILLHGEGPVSTSMAREIVTKVTSLPIHTYTLPSVLAANLLQFYVENGKKSVIIHQASGESGERLRRLINETIKPKEVGVEIVEILVDSSELALADGALTCCSLLW